MKPNKIVLRFINGNIWKGQTSDFFPNKHHFHIQQLNGEIVEVDINQLKAIFFVKDYSGNKNHIKRYNDTVTGAGRKVRVTFFDGECITGYTQGYSPDRQGFFVIPADMKGNNERIYVIRGSIISIEFCDILSGNAQVLDQASLPHIKRE
ncbi:MAG: hypothetical protein HZC49_13945 [Nitrospirae bacterium]|nr:hypothetical protein [Nitrospirota bacterium]